jgi:HK97 family phage major capsid protein
MTGNNMTLRDGRAEQRVIYRFSLNKIEQRADGSITASLSSEAPFSRDRGDEILVHTPDAVNLERAGNLPLLMDHNPSRQIGAVRNVRLESRRLVAEIIPSARADVAEIWKDIRNGVRPGISVGYVVEATEPAPGGAYRVTRWTLFEVSSVAIPADYSVGVGRTAAAFSEDTEMNMQTRHIENAPAPATAPVAPQAQPSTARAAPADNAEVERVRGISALATRLGGRFRELGLEAISEGRSVEQFMRMVDQNDSPATPMRFAEGAAIDPQFASLERSFSVTRAVSDYLSVGRLSGREKEISDELNKRASRSPTGFYMPLAALEERTHLAGTPTAGGNLIGTDYMPDQFISPFRKKARVVDLGATVLPNLVGNVELPRQDTKMAGEWVGEDTGATETDLTFSKVSMSPKTVTGNMSWSRQMATQGLPEMENLLRGELLTQLGLSLDFASIHGTGSSNMPRGILATSGIGSVPIGANGGAPTLDHLIDLESALTTVDVDEDGWAYLTNPKVMAVLKKLKTSTGEYLWTAAMNGDRSAAPGRINGYGIASTTQVASTLTKGSGSNLSAVIFGNWRDLVIGMWSGVDIVVDPFTYSNVGRVRISGFLSADISVRHASSFAAIVDAVTG